MQPLRSLPNTVRVAQALSRTLTWGIPCDQRRDLLAESDHDWEMMYRDQGPYRLLARALRGIPMTIWARMEERDHTALPAAITFALLAVAGIGAGLLDRMYPVDIRRYVFVSALGLGLTGIAMARSPRSIPLSRLRVPALVLFVGFLGMATNMPSASDWRYPTPVVGSAAGDALIVAGFAVVAFGCLVMAAGTARLFRVGGITIIAGAILFGVGQIVWGVEAVTVEPAVTATSLPLGLGALVIAHVTPRLRHLVTE